MRNKNAKLKEAIIKLSSDDGTELAELIRAIAKRRSSGLRDNTDLFFQVEPFAREFQEYSLDQPGDRNAVYGFTISNRIGLLKRDPPLLKYKAMFFGWLSYYHPNDARKFCKNIKLDIPFYKGHPDLSDCSDEAKDIFQKQDRDLTEVDPKPKTIEVVKDTDDQGVLSNIDDDKPALSKTNEPKRQFNKPAFFIVGSLILLALLSFGLWSKGFFALKTDDANNQVAAPPEGANEEVDKQNAASDKSEVSVSAKPTPSNLDTREIPKQLPTSRTARWSNYSWLDWATEADNHFLQAVRQSDKQELLQAANNGDAKAKLFLAIAGHRGVFDEVNHKAELKNYLEPSCANGEGWACTSIAFHYLSGKGYSNNPFKALEYAKKACKAGNYLGCNLKLLEDALKTSTAITLTEDVMNRTPNVANLQTDCKKGDSGACMKLSTVYMLGDGVKRDIDRARGLWGIAQFNSKGRNIPDFDEFYELKR